MTILASLKNIHLNFGQKNIFDGAEISISKGDRIGLIGLNGQGKSTLFKLLTKELQPEQSTPPFIFDQSNEPYETFLIPQELNIHDFSHLSIENYYLAFYPELYNIHSELEKDFSNQDLLHKFEELGGWDIQSRYINYLKGFELDDQSRSVQNLSGGEKRKMALSIGLSSKAEFLLWDEPTNHLDIETIERFEEELMNCSKTYMIISHDRYLLNHTTQRICHIERGKITNFHGTYLDYLEYLEEKEAELQKNLDKLENRHRRELAWMRQGIKARGTRSKKRVEGFHNIEAKIKDIKSKSKKTIELDLQHSGRKSKVLVNITEGSFAYQSKSIFEDINLSLCKKDKIALIGPNGAGKSTLIKIFQEQLLLNSGVQKNAQDLKIIVFDQNRESLDETQTPLEIIGEGSDYITFSDGSKKHINSYLNNFLFNSDQVNRPVSTLSGGERNRLQLAKFMKQSADLWVFDEPTNDLDLESIELLEKELKTYEDAVVIISHDRAFLDNVCEKTWLIHQNRLEIFEGGYTQIAPYLHAIELEKSLPKQEKSPSSFSEPLAQEPISKKLTYNEKKRLLVIEDIIHQEEAKLENINHQLASFDFAQMDLGKQNQYESLSLAKEKQEREIEGLYLEWEDLNSKSE